jgi:hypothetical protein
MGALFDGAWGRTLEYLEKQYNDGRRYRLHYVTARQMYEAVKAAEAGQEWQPPAPPEGVPH